MAEENIMKVFKDGINLPGWNPKISLAKGLKLYIKWIQFEKN